MEMNMSIAGVRKAPSATTDTLILDRLRSANARLQMQVNAANRKAASADQTAADLKKVQAELANAKKTIADLTAKMKSLSSKFEKKFKANKIEVSKKDEKAE